MRPRRSTPLLAFIVLASLGPVADAADPPTYEREIRPILARRCLVCHNVKELDDPETSAGLALDSYAATMSGTPKSKVVVPGKPGESSIVQRLDDPDDEKRMPLGDTRLTPAQRDLIRRWVEAGAPRGEPASPPKVAAGARPTRRVVRSLDLTIPIPSGPPRNVAFEARLKIGPLPAVSSLAFSPGGSVLAVGTHGQVTFWDLKTREVIRVVDDLPGPVLALAFRPDGKAVAIGAGLPARSGLLRVIGWPDGKTLRSFEDHKDAVAGLSFRPDGKAIATASYDGTVRFWDLVAGKPSGVFKGHSDFVLDVAYLPDGKSVLSASKDRTLKRIDAATAAEIRSFGEHNEAVLALAVRPDGSGFVSAGTEPAVRVWAVDAEKSMKRINASSGPVHQLAFSRDGKRLASASGDKSIRVFDAASLAPLKSLAGPSDWQYAVALTADGRKVAGGGWDGVVRLWDVEAAKLETIFVQPPSSSPGQPEGLAIDADGTLKGSDDLRSLVRWSVGGKEVKALPPITPK